MKNSLVRVQPDFTGLTNKNNTLNIERVGDTYRNTIHFSINGVVGSHEFGNWDECRIVIITPLENISIPASGVRLEDTWFHSGKNGINLGEAIILVPIGTQPPKELEKFIQYYPTTGVQEEDIKLRNQAVINTLNSIGIKDTYTIGRNSAYKNNELISYQEYITLCDIIKSQLINSKEATSDNHLHTFDSHLENIIPWLTKQIDYFKNIDTSIEIDGVNTEIYPICIKSIADTLEKINEIPNHIKEHANDYFNKIAQKLKETKEEIQEIEKKYSKPYQLFVDNKLLPPKSENEVINLIEIIFKIQKTDLFDKIEIIDITPYHGEKNRNIGTLSEIFDYEITKMKKLDKLKIDLPKNTVITLSSSLKL